MRFPLIVTCRRSTPVFVFVATVHVFGASAIFAAGGATDELRLVASGLLLASLAASWRSWRSARGQLRLNAGGVCEYRVAEDQEFHPAECCWSTVWPRLAVAGFRLPGAKRCLGFVLLGGAMRADELRLFRVWLLNCRAKSD